MSRRALIGIIVGGLIVATIALIVAERAGHELRQREAEQQSRNAAITVISLSEDGTAVFRNDSEDHEIRHASLTLTCDGLEVRSIVVERIAPRATEAVEFNYECERAEVNVGALLLN